MSKIRILGVFLVIVLLVVGCAPRAAPAPAPQAPAAATAKPAAPAPVSAAQAKPAWQAEWDRVLSAAKQEGRVVIATSAGGPLRTAMAEGFRKALGISAEAMSGKGTDIAVKIQAERRAGIYSFDVYVGGSTTQITQLKPIGALAPLEPAFILPELTDPELIKKTWFQGKLGWIDGDRTMIISAAYPNYPMAINTNLVKEGDIKSYRDLLLPKWKDKVILNNPTLPGVGDSFLAFCNYVLGWDYLVELANTKPMVLTDQRLMIEWLAHGKVAVVVPPKTDTLTDFIQAGAPVKGIIPKEGTWLAGGSGDLSLFRDAPHSNAAKLFINWFLGKEGNTLFVRAAGYHSARLDVPTDFLATDQLREPNVNYFMKENEQVLLGQPELNKKSRALLESLGLIK